MTLTNEEIAQRRERTKALAVAPDRFELHAVHRDGVPRVIETFGDPVTALRRRDELSTPERRHHVLFMVGDNYDAELGWLEWDKSPWFDEDGAPTEWPRSGRRSSP